MKKAKVILTAITVLTVVGGALAFRAKTLGQGTVFINRQVGQEVHCDALADFVTTTTTAPGIFLSATTVADHNSPCTQEIYVTTTDL